MRALAQPPLSSLRTQGPIPAAGVVEKRRSTALLKLPRPVVMGPCIRRDDSEGCLIFEYAASDRRVGKAQRAHLPRHVAKGGHGASAPLPTLRSLLPHLPHRVRLQ